MTNLLLFISLFCSIANARAQELYLHDYQFDIYSNLNVSQGVVAGEREARVLGLITLSINSDENVLWADAQLKSARSPYSATYTISAQVLSPRPVRHHSTSSAVVKRVFLQANRKVNFEVPVSELNMRWDGRKSPTMSEVPLSELIPNEPSRLQFGKFLRRNKLHVKRRLNDVELVIDVESNSGNQTFTHMLYAGNSQRPFLLDSEIDDLYRATNARGFGRFFRIFKSGCAGLLVD